MILNTRPELYQDRFHSAFSDIGLSILDCPVLVPEATSVTFPDPSAFDAVILTSQIPLTMFPAASAWLSKKVYAVGPVTESAARAAGFSNVVCTGLDAADMEQYLLDESFRLALYASAEDVAKDLSEVFSLRVQRVPVYRMVPVNNIMGHVLNTIMSKAQIIVPLFSRRSAKTVVSLLDKAKVTSASSQLYAVGISHDLFADEEGPWQCCAVAPSSTLEAMVAATREVAKSLGFYQR